jgi:hypothetical protein
MIKKLLTYVNLKRPGMVYVHPWEIDPKIPRWKTSLLIKVIQYYRLQSTEIKLRKLLKEFDFAPIGEVLKYQEIHHKEI